MASRRRKDIPSIPVFSSTIASNSDVPPPYMVDRVYYAACNSSSELLIELERVYLLGQSQGEVFDDVVRYAVSCHNVSAIKTLFRVDIDRTRHLTEKEVDVNAVAPDVIGRAVQYERTDADILSLFLDLGLDVTRSFGHHGDALMWAVRIGRWNLTQRVLDQKGTFDVDEVKFQKHGSHFTLLAAVSDRIRIADELHHYGGHDSEEIPIWADQKRMALELLNRGARIHGTCLLPNLAADPQRKEQSVSFARMLIDEFDADVNEWFGHDVVMHRRWSRESISTALYEAVRNNFPSMVELLLDKGADPKVKGHKKLSLIECAWDNKHSNMVRLLRERAVPDGPKTRGKDVATMYSSSSRRRRRRPPAD